MNPGFVVSVIAGVIVTVLVVRKISIWYSIVSTQKEAVEGAFKEFEEKAAAVRSQK